ncbi:MAG: HD domain-containing protein [Candidatus Lokiarchaeota archaeon]|nr:HD domain-containing protein [Candidatus Lokiarchaeota archaeon]
MKDRNSLKELLDNILDSQNNLQSYQIVLLKKAGEFSIEKMNPSDVHGFRHVLRVMHLCLKIQKEEGSNIFILLLSTLLHDIGRDYAKQNQNHAELSVELAQTFFSECINVLSQRDINHIVECMRAHSFSTGVKAKSLEAKILSDADKIDALGAVGIYRAACFQHENGTGLFAMHQHFYDKLLDLPSKMYTQTGQKLANERIDLMNTYISSLTNEIGISLQNTDDLR